MRGGNRRKLYGHFGGWRAGGTKEGKTRCCLQCRAIPLSVFPFAGADVEGRAGSGYREEGSGWRDIPKRLLKNRSRPACRRAVRMTGALE